MPQGRRLPPPDASWWAVHATVQLSKGNVKGQIRVQFPEIAGHNANQVIYEEDMRNVYADPRWTGLSLQYLLDQWRRSEAVLKEWEL